MRSEGSKGYPMGYFYQGAGKDEGSFGQGDAKNRDDIFERPYL